MRAKKIYHLLIYICSVHHTKLYASDDVLNYVNDSFELRECLVYIAGVGVGGVVWSVC